MSTTTSLFKWARFSAFFFFLGTTSLLQANQQLTGHIPIEAENASYLGAMDTSKTLNLAISLSPQNSEDLQQFLANVYDPHHPLYHHFLTPAEFAQRYGATDADYQAVMDFAKAHHLTVTRTYPNKLLVDVQGSVDDIQKTFHVHLKRLQRPDGSEFHAPDQEPSVDLSVPIAHVAGLENYQIPKPTLTHVNLAQLSSQAHPSSGTGPVTLGVYPYWGNDFRNAYFPTVGACNLSSLNGAGQTIALVEFDAYYPLDISNYATATGIAFNVNTQAQPITIDAADGGGTPGGSNGEVALDIEMIMCMSPSAQVLVFEAPNSSPNPETTADDMLTKIATYSSAKQISCSWTGFGDSGVTAIFSQYAAQGQSFFQAAGDTGAYVSGDNPSSVPGPMNVTNVSNLITVVGGTELQTSGTHDALGNYTGDTVWNQGNAAGSGGVANPVPIPTYQAPFISINNQGSTNYRNIPDVSWTAYDLFIYDNNGGTDLVGGTSAAAPLWAGLTALINENAGASAPVGLINPMLYFLAKNFYNNEFNDVVSGNNNISGTSSTTYSAQIGYDLASGLGSPKCALINDIVNPPPTYTPTPTATPTNTPLPPTTNTFYVYPQPAHGQVSIAYNSDSVQTIKITVYNLMGQLVGTFMDTAAISNQNRTSLSLSGFAPGVYYFVMTGSVSGVMNKGKFLAEP